MHHVRTTGDKTAAASAAAGAGPGSSKRALPVNAAEPAEDGGKRARHADVGKAGGSGNGAGADEASAATADGGDPLERVPDAPMHLMRVRGIPR